VNGQFDEPDRDLNDRQDSPNMPFQPKFPRSPSGRDLGRSPHSPACLRMRIGGRGFGLAVALFLFAGGCNKPPPPAPATPVKGKGGAAAKTGTATQAPAKGTQARFEDVTEAIGLKFEFRDGQEAGHCAIVESLGGGTAIFDYDADGWPDVFFTGGGRYGPIPEMYGLPGALFRNLDGKGQVDVTKAAGVGAAPYFSHGAATGDFDDDGFTDLLVTGYGGLVLFRNLGDGTFVESAKSVGLDDSSWSSSAGWGDLNGDSILDLYVAHYVDWSFDNHKFCAGPKPGQREVCAPKEFTGLPDIVYYGRGDGTFRDATQEAGLRPDGKGLGVIIGDVDLDGDLDIYVGNDTVPNFLYRNLGEGRFEEIGHLSGTALSDRATPDGSMGVDMGDFNLDGLPDLWVANYERESIALYRNEGNCQFLHVSRSTGVTAVGALFVSFGTLFFDFDRDGDEDVVVTNGHVIRYPVNAPLRQLPLLFENRKGRFENVAPQAGKFFTEPRMGRGVASGDLDRDGDLDLVFAPINEPPSVVLNSSPNENSWLRVRLIGTRSQRDAVGARLTLKTSAGEQTRQVKGGGSYLSQSELHCFFGIPKGATLEKLTILWPSGLRQELDRVAVNQTLTVIEPATGTETQ
jgi:enediyne biosynthesis protein E4